MRSAAHLSHHRLTQAHRWAMLWLNWVASLLAAACDYTPLPSQMRAIAHAWLDEIEHVVLGVAMIRAAPHVRLVYPNVVVENLRQAGVRRAIIGSRLRRLMRVRDVRARITALRQDIDAFVASILRRLPRGLTCRRPIRTRRQASVTPPPSAPLAYARGADTS